MKKEAIITIFHSLAQSNGSYGRLLSAGGQKAESDMKQPIIVILLSYENNNLSLQDRNRSKRPRKFILHTGKQRKTNTANI